MASISFSFNQTWPVFPVQHLPLHALQASGSNPNLKPSFVMKAMAQKLKAR
jgi:hypothetical protein